MVLDALTVPLPWHSLHLFLISSCAAALLTGDDIHHLSEGAVSYNTLLACAVAGRAGIYGGARFCAAAVAVAAGIVLGDGEFLLHTGEGFPKVMVIS